MNLHDYSLSELKTLLNQKKISAKEIASYYAKRIKKYNPGLNAFLTQADEPTVDEKKKKGALYGIPFSMKDTYMTKGFRTSAGSKVLEDHIASYDATVTKRLKDAGAVLVGKTNCDAWGHGSSTENSDYGITKNPWNPEYVAGGSSGGSAAAVSANLSVFDIGEDTGGSIRLPASFCGIVGLKTTYGLVSRYGCIAYASSLDTVGPMTRSVADCAMILEVMAGTDSYDATTARARVAPYTKLLDKSLKGLKAGIPKEYFMKGIDPEVIQHVEKSITVLKKLGVELVEISLPMTEYAVSTYYLIAPSETSSNLARFDGIRYGNGRSLFGSEAKRRIMLGTYTLSAGYYDAYYKKATKVRTLIKQDFEKAFEKVDFIITPVSPTPAFKIGEKANDPLQMYLSDIFTISINLAGVPALSIPCGISKSGLPIGLQLIGKHYDETQILNVAHEFEKETEFYGIIKRGIENYRD